MEEHFLGWGVDIMKVSLPAANEADNYFQFASGELPSQIFTCDGKLKAELNAGDSIIFKTIKRKFLWWTWIVWKEYKHG